MNRYIEHIIKDLVRDTRIGYYDIDMFKPPYPSPALSPFHLTIRHFPDPPFLDYCRDTYGLTDQEIKYVWERYKDIILDKINE